MGIIDRIINHFVIQAEIWALKKKTREAREEFEIAHLCLGQSLFVGPKNHDRIKFCAEKMELKRKAYFDAKEELERWAR